MCPVPPLLLKQNHFSLKFYHIFRPANELKGWAVLGIWVQTALCSHLKLGPLFREWCAFWVLTLQEDHQV
jgi:hypothetical protein